MQRSRPDAVNGRVGALLRRLVGGRARGLPSATVAAAEALRRRCRVRVRENGSVEVAITVLRAPSSGRKPGERPKGTQ